MASCRSCNAEIEFVKSATTGKFVPLDLKPTADGNLFVNNGFVHAFDNEPSRVRRTSHFATCPQASSWRKK
jgi:hypothetical protein